VVSGASDWADSTVGNPAIQRVGVVHAAANVVATTLFAGSLAARRSGARGRGKLLGLAGAAVLTAGGHLGGHLSLAEGIGVDQTAFEQPEDEWKDALDDAELAEAQPQVVDVDGVPVMLVRQHGEVFALSNRCSHRGGPLDEGDLEDGCVVCPWHGSAFRLSDGSLERGPSAYPQPAWETRVEGGRIRVRPLAG
jgi:nitrite reductase/ring-hydroxylating ferredoxin subunit